MMAPPLFRSNTWSFSTSDMCPDFLWYAGRMIEEMNHKIKQQLSNLSKPGTFIFKSLKKTALNSMFNQVTLFQSILQTSQSIITWEGMSVSMYIFNIIYIYIWKAWCQWDRAIQYHTEPHVERLQYQHGIDTAVEISCKISVSPLLGTCFALFLGASVLLVWFWPQNANCATVYYHHQNPVKINDFLRYWPLPLWVFHFGLDRSTKIWWWVAIFGALESLAFHPQLTVILASFRKASSMGFISDEWKAWETFRACHPGQDATWPDFDFSKVIQLAPVQLGRAFLLDSVCRRLRFQFWKL